jgi:lipopolysaccharide/colanic/teichoic acid biosynthesis glycosyltransferase
MGMQSSNLGQTNLYQHISSRTEIIPAAPPFACQTAIAPTTENNAKTWANSGAKRLFDLTVALAAVLILLPLFMVIALLVKLTSSGPVLFRQQRVGKGQVPFTIYKFRTMRTATDLETEGSSVTRSDDHRLTKIGHYLRKSKLDELPQLFNVVLGDMSLVGPRPKLPKHERMKMTCKPGITGSATLVFAQEQALLASLPEESFEHFTIYVLNEIKAQIDTEYVRTCTFKSDMRLILSTVTGFWYRQPAGNITELLQTYGHAPVTTATFISH